MLFLDTGYHFAATYDYRDRMAREWNLNMRNLTAKKTVAEQEAEFGILNRTDPGRCCHLRKVEPLFEALEEFDVWFTGLRREQSPTRKNLKVAEHHVLPTGKVLLEGEPAGGLDLGRRVEIHRGKENRLFCRCTTPDTAASAASRALPCRSMAPIRVPGDGAGRNWNAEFIRNQNGAEHRKCLTT